MIQRLNSHGPCRTSTSSLKIHSMMGQLRSRRRALLPDSDRAAIDAELALHVHVLRSDAGNEDQSPARHNCAAASI